jgi:MFS family permease
MSMLTTLASFAGLFSAVFSLLMGVGLLGTLLSLRMTLEGFSAPTVGMMMAAYYAGLVLGSFVSRHLIEQVGHIRAFAAFAAVATTTALLHGLYVSAIFWSLLRVVTGVMTMGLYMVIESWLNECTVPQSRGRVFSVYMMLSYLGVGAGQLLLNTGDVAGPQLFLVSGMLLTLCLVPVAVTRSAQPRLPGPSRFNLAALVSRAPLGFLGCVTAGLITSAFYAMGPVFSHRIGLSTSETAWFMFVAIFGGLALQWPLGLLSDRLDRTLVLAALAATVAAAAVAIMAATHYRQGWLIPMMGMFGGFIFTLYPVAVARTHDLFHPEDIVAVSSVLLLGYGVGATIGPLAAAAVMVVSESTYGLFGFQAGIAALYAGAVLYFRKQERIERIPVDAQVGFVPMRTTSAVALVMDPRVESPPPDGPQP